MFFSRKTGSSLLVLDIGSASIGGGLAYTEPGNLPVMCYTDRADVARAEGDALTNAMLHTLEEVIARLLKEGAPMLRQLAGSGRIDRVIASIGAPWQESKVIALPIANEAPFTYTKTLEKETLTAGDPPKGRVERQQVLATFLNGYLVREPYGREAARAELVVLSSIIETRIIEAVESRIGGAFHISEISYTDFAAPSYRVLSSLYPHEDDFLMLRITDEVTEVASMKRGHLLDVGSIEHGTGALKRGIREASETLARVADENPNFIDAAHNARFEVASNKAEAAWATPLAGLLGQFAIRHALPRTVFLIAEDDSRDFLKQALNDPSLRALWLSDEPVSIIPILPQQFTQRIKTQGLASGDVPLAVLALYASLEG